MWRRRVVCSIQNNQVKLPRQTGIFKMRRSGKKQAGNEPFLRGGVSDGRKKEIRGKYVSRGKALSAAWHPGLDPGTEKWVKSEQSLELRSSERSRGGVLVLSNVRGNVR